MVNGKLIRLLREFKKIKQGALARRMGITQQAISKLEKKTWIDQPTYNKVVEALGYSNYDWDEIRNILQSISEISKRIKSLKII